MRLKDNNSRANNRPYVLLSCAMTIDGKISTISGDTELSDEHDWKEVHKLRTECDAIMVGKNTILNDDPKLHIKFFPPQKLTRIVVDSNFSIPLKSMVITFEPEMYPTIIAITNNAPSSKISKVKSPHITFINTGLEKQVNLKKLLEILNQIGIKKIMLEGGGTLNWSMLYNGFVDEMRIFLSPIIVGGKGATSLVGGEGVKKMTQGFKFNLLNVEKRNDFIVLRYLKA